MKNLTQTLVFFLLVTQICFGQWYQQNIYTTLWYEDVYFADTSNGWIVGREAILRTTDGGEVWTIQSNDNWLHSVYFTNKFSGWAVGHKYNSGGTVLHTNNGGTTWENQISGATYGFGDVCFTNANTGWITGDKGTLLHTNDGGTTWVTQSLDTLFSLGKICFADSNNGWIIGWDIRYPILNYTIFHTINGGATWLPQWNWTIAEPYSIYFPDPNTGWMVGGGWWGPAFILHTIDGGFTWLPQSGGVMIGPIDVYFINNTVGWVVGWAGAIIHTTDGGESWTVQSEGTAEELNSIYFVNENEGWAVGGLSGGGGTIFHTTNGGVTFVEEEKTNEVPAEFLLSQNYPNPFNPSTKIKYSIPQSSNVIIKVFDVLGNEIETLVSEEKPAGTYEIEFNAASLPSGVYFYQLKAGTFAETKKMVLMK